MQDQGQIVLKRLCRLGKTKDDCQLVIFNQAAIPLLFLQEIGIINPWRYRFVNKRVTPTATALTDNEPRQWYEYVTDRWIIAEEIEAVAVDLLTRLPANFNPIA